jgi:ferredoxin
LRVHVDSERCQGHGLCAYYGPDIFELDDLGYSKPGFREVREGLEAQALRGVQACPERAINIVESLPVTGVDPANPDDGDRT